MTSDEPHLPRRHRTDDVPPYAPRSVTVTDPAESDVQPTAGPAEVAGSTPAGRGRSPEQAEEAAAYAEAHDQGLLSDDEWARAVADQDAEFEAATSADADSAVTQAIGLQAEPVLEPGAEPDPATAVLPTPEDVLWTEPTTALPVGDQPTAAELKGAEQESARQRRQRRAATRLAATKHGGFRDEPVRTLVRGLGQTLITIGVVLLLFVVYEVYVTDLFGAQKQAAAKESMEERWESATDIPPAPDPSETGEAVTVAPSAAQVADPIERTRKYTTEIGQGFANINIPAFGADYSFTIVEGTTTEDLYGNPGHYDDTQYPGELGNFAVAGHRVSKGSPFNALGELQSCDALVIETQDDWFVYRVLPMTEEMATWDPASRPECADVAPLTGAYEGLPGRQITLPSDYAQVLPIPRVNAAGPEALAAATERIITLTTCHPQFSDAERMIVHGVLTKTYAKADGFVPPELSE